jgi:hypothetical protein
MSAVRVTTRTFSNNFRYLRRKTGQLTRIAAIFFCLEFAKLKKSANSFQAQKNKLLQTRQQFLKTDNNAFLPRQGLFTRLHNLLSMRDILSDAAGLGIR